MIRFRPALVLGAVLSAAVMSACGSSHPGNGSAAPTSSGSVSVSSVSSTVPATAAPTSAATAPAVASSKFCSDVTKANFQLVKWTAATPGSADAAAEPLAAAYAKIAGEAPAVIRPQVQDLAATFLQLEKFDKVTDPATLLQEGPLTTGHVTPDSNAIGTYADTHCG